jgi:hypothetical protein
MSLSQTGYQEPPEHKQFVLLPEGDYSFKVMDCRGLDIEDNGNEKVSLVLYIQDRDIFVYLYEGQGRKGPFDMISPFLKAIGQRPTADQVNDPKYWAGLKGKTGRCRLKIERQQGGKYDGKEVNKVAYWIYPDAPPHRAPSAAATSRAPAAASTTDDIPDDIPFRTRIYRDVRTSRLNKTVF